jgi:hypothetical protein
VQVFTQLGLLLNLTKCVLEPRQQVVYLGQQIDLQSRTVSPIPHKVTQVRKSLRHIVPGKLIRPSVLAALGGTLLDLSKGAVNLIGYPKEIMSFAGRLALQHGWYQTCPKTAQVRILLQKVRESLREIYPVQLLPPSPHCLMSVLSTDASDYGWGASLQKPGMKRPLSARQFFTPMERMTWHITRKETAALCRGVASFLEDIPPNSFLRIHTDSVTARAAFQKGSSKSHINQEVRLVRVLLAKRQIYAESHWIPGASNVDADVLSRKLTDRNDYSVPLSQLRQVCQQLNVEPVLDMFAADHNHKFPKFWSWTRSPFAMAQDAFAQNWSQEVQGTMYANPPWPVISQFLQKVQIDKARVLFLLPLWKGQPWWPLLWSMLESRLIVHHHPRFVDRWGVALPPPRWKVCFGIINGSLSTRVS